MHRLTVSLAIVQHVVLELAHLILSLHLVHLLLRVDMRDLHAVEELGVLWDAEGFSISKALRWLAHCINLSARALTFHGPLPALVDTRVSMNVELGFVGLHGVMVGLAFRIFHLVVDEGAYTVLDLDLAVALLLLANLLGLLFLFYLCIGLLFSIFLFLRLEVVLDIHDLNGEEQRRVRWDSWLGNWAVAELRWADYLGFCTFLQPNESLVQALELRLAYVERVGPVLLVC